MNKGVLITGATSGIGLEFAKIFARHSHDLVLVARNEEHLKRVAREIEQEFGVTTKTIVKDLSKSPAAQELFEETVALGIQIDVLINNAGAGLNGRFIDNNLDAELGILQLNAVSLATLCHLFGGAMAKRRSGRILNVASTASFQPGPMMSNYYASKAYVLLLSEGLRSELKADGVVVTALCPGPTKTELFAKADMNNTLMARVPYLLTAAQVADSGYHALMRGRGVVVVGLFNKLLAFSTRLAPRVVLAGIARLINTKRPPRIVQHSAPS